MISELYRQLKAIADKEFGEIVEDSEIINSYTGRPRKLRLSLIDSTFADIWYSVDGAYSFHWEQGELRCREQLELPSNKYFQAHMKGQNKNKIWILNAPIATALVRRQERVKSTIY